jgi:hypothetical protein
MTVSCEDFLKKESTTIGLAQEVWRNLITFMRLLTALTNTPFEKLQERRAKHQCMSSRKLGEFSASVVIT